MKKKTIKSKKKNSRFIKQIISNFRFIVITFSLKRFNKSTFFNHQLITVLLNIYQDVWCKLNLIQSEIVNNNMQNAINRIKTKHIQAVINWKREQTKTRFPSLFQTFHFLIYCRKMRILNTFFGLIQLNDIQKISINVKQKQKLKTNSKSSWFIIRNKIDRLVLWYFYQRLLFC